MKNLSVLIIDDNALDRKVFKVAFEKAGVKAITLGEPEMAIDYAIEHAPNFIVLDLYMPGVNGFEVCQQIKLDPRTRHIPVMFVSSSESLDDVAASLHMGVIDYFHKPVSIDYLVQQVIKHDVINKISEIVKPMKDSLTRFSEKYRNGI